MNKLNTTILYLAIFALCLAVPVSAMAALNIEFEYDPLFSNANILPGDSVSRWVKADNTGNSGSYQTAVRAINEDNSDGLGDQMTIQIVDHNTAHSYYSGTLSDFLNESYILLSVVAPDVIAQYDFTIDFLKETGNDYQGKTLVFKIEVGFKEMALAGANETTSFFTTGIDDGIFFASSDSVKMPTMIKDSEDSKDAGIAVGDKPEEAEYTAQAEKQSTMVENSSSLAFNSSFSTAAQPDKKLIFPSARTGQDTAANKFTGLELAFVLIFVALFFIISRLLRKRNIAENNIK